MKPDYDIAIVGAGFSGIVAALRLRESGRNGFVILERAEEVGGTWRDNTYPGCACDVPSNLYSISAAPNPGWSRAYSAHAEILDYLKGVVARHDLRPQIRFGFEVYRLEFLEAWGLWRVTDRAGGSLLARSVILGTGPFARPRMPEIPGIERFAGDRLHSARWDHGVRLEGRRVGVVGTGASAVQIVPAIAPQVSRLTVFQRSAAWIGDRMDADVPLARQAQYRRQPWRQALVRGLLYWVLEARGRLFTGNRLIHRYFKNLSLRKLEREVPDPELRRKLTPAYEFGCKRILSSDDYWPAFSRPNVALETDRIAEITPSGVRTAGGTLHELDVMVFATGFEVAEITHDVKIYGLGGRELFAEWREGGLEAYKGASVSGFPNLNYLLGPNTGLGHSSMIAVMESQMTYILGYLDLLDSLGAAYLDLRPEAQSRYNRHLQAQFEGTVWASGCASWYLNAQGKNTTLYPRLLESFRRATRRVRADEYRQVRLRQG